MLAGIAGALAWGVSIELQASPLQSRLFTKLASGFHYSVEPGSNPDARFPDAGPYDERLGYSRLPAFIRSLEQQGFVVTHQARLSPELTRFVDNGGFAIFREKAQAGVLLKDRAGEVLYFSRYPERVFADFDAVPRLVVDTLLFIENRELLDNRYPTRNPAVEWDRFVAAAANAVTGQLESGGKRFGGSTLATQIEKFRHSPEGRTGGIEDKLRQITTASVRAYQDGPLTTGARQRIVVEYINSTPLSARAGFGEVIGLGDGLWAWYGTDLKEAARLLEGAAQDRGRAPAGGDDLQTGAQPPARTAPALALSAAGPRRSRSTLERVPTVDGRRGHHFRRPARARHGDATPIQGRCAYGRGNLVHRRQGDQRDAGAPDVVTPCAAILRPGPPRHECEIVSWTRQRSGGSSTSSERSPMGPRRPGSG